VSPPGPLASATSWRSGAKASLSPGTPASCANASRTATSCARPRAPGGSVAQHDVARRGARGCAGLRADAMVGDCVGKMGRGVLSRGGDVMELVHCGEVDFADLRRPPCFRVSGGREGSRGGAGRSGAVAHPRGERLLEQAARDRAARGVV